MFKFTFQVLFTGIYRRICKFNHENLLPKDRPIISCPKRTPVYLQSARNASSNGNGDDSDSDVEYNLNLDSQVIDMSLRNSFEVRDILYPKSNDKLIQELQKSATISEVVELFKAKKHSFQAHHNVQTVLTIWDIQRNSISSPVNCHAISHRHDSNGGKFEFDKEEFKDLQMRIEQSIPSLSPDELTCSVLYLNKIGLSRNDPLLVKLILQCMHGLRDGTLEFGFAALSRLTVSLNANKDFTPYFTYPIVVPRIIEMLNECKTADDLTLVTVCLKNVYWYLNKEDVLELYKTKVYAMNDLGVFHAGSPRVILKVTNFLNSIYWSNSNADIIRKLVLQLDMNQIAFQHELNMLFRLLQSQLEPAGLIKTTTEKTNFFRSKSTEISPILLQCGVFFMVPEYRTGLIQDAKDFLKNTKEPLSSESTLSIFRVLRQSKVSDTNLCDKYWDKVLQKIKNDSVEQEHYKLVHHCHRYMYFNNNLGGTYRHAELEQFFSKTIIHELEHGMSRFIPSKFAQLSAFIVAYGYDESNRKVPDFIIEKLIAIKDQLSLFDCLQISRGIQVALELRFRRAIPHEFARQLLILESIINEAVEKALSNEEKLTISDINSIVRGFNNRKASRKTPIFQKTIRKFETLKFDLTSRIIRDITFNLTTSRYRSPALCEDFLRYIVDNEEFITGDTVEKIIHCCYFLGHATENLKALEVSSRIVERDFEFMSGLSIVNSCLALSFYQLLPESLTNRVFCIEFIKRLEDEIKMCYSKATYPYKVLNKVMQLNRSVCLDCPDYNVPWFQQNYVEAQTTRVPPNQRFQEEFVQYLTMIFKNHQLIERNHNTAYGYRIDFLLNLDKNNQLVLKNSNVKVHKKLAVILMTPESFCENHTSHVCGFELLRQRHLEILGFHVARVNFSEWNSMFMNVEGAKRDFIERILQIKM